MYTLISYACTNNPDERTTLMATLVEIKDFNAYALSDGDFAGCGTPDTLESAGAMFLTRVRDALVEAVESGRITPSQERTNGEEASDIIHEIADDAPSVYTATKWAQFVDLAAYQEDPTEYGDISDMDSAAGVCLYIIAERLCNALVDALAADANDDDDDTEEDA
jgi:hypothetical protein